VTFYFPQLSIYNNLHKRLQNVKSPQKRQGPTPERGQPKKRCRIDFSSSDNGDDDADSSGGSTVILHETPGSSSDDGHHSACKLITTRLGNIMILFNRAGY